MRPTAALAAAVLLLCFGFNMVGRGVADAYIVFLLPLGAEFGWSRSDLSSVYSIYLVVVGIAAPLTGMLFDRFGPRLVYVLGLATLGAGCFVAATLTKLWQFQLALGLLGGIGVSALGMIPASALIRRWFRENLSTAIGVAYAGMGSGALVIVPASQWLIERIGWRDAYRTLGLGVLVLLPVVALLPWRRLAGGTPSSPRASPGAPSPAPARAFRDVLRQREYWALAQVFFFTALAMYTVLVQTVAYLVERGFAPLAAAGAFGVSGMLSVAGVIAAGWLSDRLGYRRTATLTFMLTLAGVACLLVLSWRPSTWALAAFVILFGIAQGARGPIVASLAAKLFPGPGFATIYGTIFAAMSLGAGVGSWISGLLYDATGGYVASFTLSMASLLVAATPFWTVPALERGTRRGGAA